MEYGRIFINLFLLKQNDGNQTDDKYDFSKYVQIGLGQTLCLDDTIDTMSLQLVNMPFRKEFEPTSLFRILISQEVFEEDEKGFITKTYDFALQQDDVEQPNMAEELFTHNLTLSNPAILAQQKTVDNIAVTYKLQDVSLESSSAIIIDVNKNTIPTINQANWNPSFYPENTNLVFGDHTIGIDRYMAYAHRYRLGVPTITYPAGTITESNRGVITNIDYSCNYYKNIKRNYFAGDGSPFVVDNVTYYTYEYIDIPLPLLEIQSSVDGTRDYGFTGYLPVDLTIEDYDGDVADESRLLSRNTYTFYPSKYLKLSDNDTSIDSIWNGVVAYTHNPNITYGYILGHDGGNGVLVSQLFGTYTDDILVNNRPKNSVVRLMFDTTKAHTYIIKINRHSLTQKYHYYPSSDTYGHTGSETPNPIVRSDRYDVFGFTQQSSLSRLEDNYELNIAFSFSTFPNDKQEALLFTKSKQIDAYYLFKKAQLCCATYRKQDGVAYYDTDLPFYVNESDKTLLERTQLIESDFIGKNLWEVFSEIGKYIHAKPRISIEAEPIYYNTTLVGYNMTGRFLVNWLYYGKSTIYDIEETKNSIFNSKFAQEYICELDNYVENYFNLGSYVVETLHISSDSEDSLIYNDVAKLITKYPILEILSLEAINQSGTTADITKYVFEYGIYKTLDYSDTIIPSKNRAIYYHLGENIIMGMQFVTPKPSGVECAYSMKNILGLEYGIPTSDIPAINIQDYFFRIKYRVKDSVRVSISRPDIRKYLLNSSYDLYPIHSQFNQQQDKLVSSDSFGLNAYGKLIRTGNTTYSLCNWTNKITDTMNEGDLYRLEDDLYYVSKVRRTYYPEHIEEVVELTKDFNRLAQIIGIPSQPRFYEISERNIIDRDVKFNEYVVIKCGDNSEGGDIYLDGHLSLTAANGVLSIIQALVDLPNEVFTFFKGDGDKTDYGKDSVKSLYQVYSPVVCYSSKNTLTYEWDMEDNYSAGEKSTETSETLQWSLNLFSLLRGILGDNDNQAYRARKPVRYVDVYGRADLVDFMFTRNFVLDNNEIYALPEYEMTSTKLNKVDSNNKRNYTKIKGGSNFDAIWKLRYGDMTGLDDIKSNDSGYIIAKDNREKLSFNYNLQLLLDSDRIMLGDKLWIRDLTNLRVRIMLLNTEINKFNTDLINVENNIHLTSQIEPNDLIQTINFDGKYAIYFDVESYISNFTNEELVSCKSYAIVRSEPINNTNYRLIIGRNVSDITDITKKLFNFYFCAYDKREAKTNRKQLDETYKKLYN